MVSETRETVRLFFTDRAREYGLDPAALSVEYVLNWGGFTNMSFTVRDAAHAFHVKLADDPENITGLERWARFAGRLHERHLAPPVVGRVEIPGTPLRGLLFLWIRGRHLEEAEIESRAPALVEFIRGLHTDNELAEELAALDGGVSLADRFTEVTIRRFREDLACIRQVTPDFLSLEDLGWMDGQVDALEGLVRATPEFHASTSSPVHGDLWLNNILVAPDDRLFILDWDDLAIGDPLSDYVTLFWPLTRAGVNPVLHLTGPLTHEVASRVPVFHRALLLDEVIDSLADYVEAARAPEHADCVRAEKRKTHEKAYREYQRRYAP